MTSKIGKTEQQSNSSFDLDNNTLEENENSNSDNKVTTKEQQSNTNKNVNNIYLFILNKYKRDNQKDFNEYVKTVSKMKQDPDWINLTYDEQQKLISEV